MTNNITQKQLLESQSTPYLEKKREELGKETSSELLKMRDIIITILNKREDNA